jgi:2-polyprenyl-3-methyl-5-hydroxy-6-metoxy-1,4-benzoquinol methylase
MLLEPVAHIYHRPLDPKGQDSLAKLARQVQPGSRVLDLGTGPGVLGRYLAETLGCTVDGVEVQPAAAAEAAPWYRQLQCADIETLNLAECFVGREYDFILCADILEHLRQPGALLDQITGLLAPQGRLLASVPNVAYAGLIADLLAGEFRYRPEGLLDETHLRFFTYSSLLRLLQQHGLPVIAVDATICDVRESEFSGRYLDALPPALLRGLLGRPDALVYQFIVTAAAATEAGETASLLPLTSPPPELRFACQLFWRPATDSYQEDESSVVCGRLGAERQMIILPIPARTLMPGALRLDLADRPGLLHLHAMTLHDPSGRLLWAWDGCRDSLAAGAVQQLAFAQLHPLTSGVTVLLTDTDPILELPIPAPALTGLQHGGELRLDLSWPMSLDYLALAQDCAPRRDVEAMRAALTEQVAQLRTAITRLTEQQQQAALAAAGWNADKTELERQLTLQAAHQLELEQQLATQAAKTAELEQQLISSQTRLNEQAAELDQLRRSGWERLRNWRLRWHG